MVHGWGSLDWNPASAPSQAITVSSLVWATDKVAACSYSVTCVEEAWRCAGSQIRACAPRVELHTSSKDAGLWSDRGGASVIS